MARAATKSGDGSFAAMEMMNAELFTLTYGAIVTQLVTDYEDADEVNTQLDKMGYNIGIRIVDEFFAKSTVDRCRSFKETADVIGKVAFPMFLGVTAEVGGWNKEQTSCTLTLTDNPLAEFVELPSSAKTLKYSNILCGAVRGALEMIQLKVSTTFEKDTLWGDSTTEIKMELLEVLSDKAGEDYDET